MVPAERFELENHPARRKISWTYRARSMSGERQSPDVERVARPPLIVHESTAILRTLDLFRKTPVHTAIVVDEFGSLQGIVTRTDLLEKLAGDLPKIDTVAKPKVTQREDGSYLIDASVPFPDVMHVIGMSEAPSGDYVNSCRLYPLAAARAAKARRLRCVGWLAFRGG